MGLSGWQQGGDGKQGPNPVKGGASELGTQDGAASDWTPWCVTSWLLSPKIISCIFRKEEKSQRKQTSKNLWSFSDEFSELIADGDFIKSCVGHGRRCFSGSQL